MWAFTGLDMIRSDPQQIQWNLVRTGPFHRPSFNAAPTAPFDQLKRLWFVEVAFMEQFQGGGAHIHTYIHTYVYTLFLGSRWELLLVPILPDTIRWHEGYWNSFRIYDLLHQEMANWTVERRLSGYIIEWLMIVYFLAYAAPAFTPDVSHRHRHLQVAFGHTTTLMEKTCGLKEDLTVSLLFLGNHLSSHGNKTRLCVHRRYCWWWADAFWSLLVFWSNIYSSRQVKWNSNCC